MTRDEANALLDALRDGEAHLPLTRINEALIATGDLAGHRSMQAIEPKREWPYYAIARETA